MYRPTTAEADGRLSPFFATAPATKYNGNIALLPAQTGQTPQEVSFLNYNYAWISDLLEGTFNFNILFKVSAIS